MHTKLQDGKTELKTPRGKLGMHGGIILKRVLERGCEDVDWIWFRVRNRVMKLCIPLKAGNFLTS
jgi:hypothetical protein